MDNSLLAVRDINHKYIVVERRKENDKPEGHHGNSIVEKKPVYGK